jgi:uncharacterized protein
MPDGQDILLITCIFLLAGWVKGVVGLGLPTVAIATLSLAMPHSEAAALLVAPSLVSNCWQFVRGPSAMGVFRRTAAMLALICVGTVIGNRFMDVGESGWPLIATGATLAAYGVSSLLLPPLRVSARAEATLSPIVGFLTGVLTGATGVFVVPVVPYLSALELRKAELIQAMGLSFAVSTVALAATLSLSGKYPQELKLASLLCVAPALAGMAVGQLMRHRIEPLAFRRWFFIALIIVGGYLVVEQIFTR